MGRGRQALKVATPLLQIKFAVIHPIEIHQLQFNLALGGATEENVGTPIVLVSQTVFVEHRRQTADGAEHLVSIVKPGGEKFFVAMNSLRAEGHKITFLKTKPSPGAHIIICHRLGSADTDGLQKERVVKRAFRLGGAEETIDKTIHPVGTAERFHHVVSPFMGQDAQFVSTFVNHLALVFSKQPGKTAHKGSQGNKIRMKSHHGGMERKTVSQIFYFQSNEFFTRTNVVQGQR